MTLWLRTLDELQHAPQMATLSALSAAIRAVCITLDLTHPDLLSRPSTCPTHAVALLLRIHLDECQELLRGYDELFFEPYGGSNRETDERVDEQRELDDLIPF
jgi:hypothetical protein